MTTDATQLDSRTATFWELTVEGFVRGTRRFYEPAIALLDWISEFKSRRHLQAKIEAKLDANIQEMYQEIVRSHCALEDLRTSIEADKQDRTSEALIRQIIKLTDNSAQLQKDIAQIRCELETVSVSATDPDLATKVAAEVIKELKAGNLFLKVSEEPDDGADLGSYWARIHLRQSEPLNIWKTLDMPIPTPLYAPLKTPENLVFKFLKHSDQSKYFKDILEKSVSRKRIRTITSAEPTSTAEPTFDTEFWEQIQREVDKRW